MKKSFVPPPPPSAKEAPPFQTYPDQLAHVCACIRVSCASTRVRARATSEGRRGSSGFIPAKTFFPTLLSFSPFSPPSTSFSLGARWGECGGNRRRRKRFPKASASRCDGSFASLSVAPGNCRDPVLLRKLTKESVGWDSCLGWLPRPSARLLT